MGLSTFSYNRVQINFCSECEIACKDYNFDKCPNCNSPTKKITLLTDSKYK